MGETVISAIYTIKCKESNQLLNPPNESRCNEGLNSSRNINPRHRPHAWRGLKGLLCDPGCFYVGGIEKKGEANKRDGNKQYLFILHT